MSQALSSAVADFTQLTIGSLCTGYGGLDLAVEAHFGAKTIWCAEFDKYASQVIEQRFDMPNYGDIKAIDWATADPSETKTPDVFKSFNHCFEELKILDSIPKSGSGPSGPRLQK